MNVGPSIKNEKADRNNDYGIDAPGLVRFFLTAGAVSAFASLATRFVFDSGAWLGLLIVTALGIVSIYLFGMGCLMLYWSKFTKFRDRERVLDLVKWSGDEQVLDVGCGRGLMLIGAALRLTTGRAVGVDIWSSNDQSSNSPEETFKNANQAGVSQKVDVQTADMRSLPFPDKSFDIVLSHWVVHNLQKEQDRGLALAEMARVLRPGGHLILCDIEHCDAYLAHLKELGLSQCRTIFQPVRDAILGILSFGSFRPTTILAKSPLSAHSYSTRRFV